MALSSPSPFLRPKDGFAGNVFQHHLQMTEKLVTDFPSLTQKKTCQKNKKKKKKKKTNKKKKNLKSMSPKQSNQSTDSLKENYQIL
jgi:hypothetical protein